jgi:hypothetical protein
MPDYHPDGKREQIHLPGPSVLPFAAAVGITVALMGLILSWWFVAVGVAVAVLVALRWAQNTRLEIEDLPRE